MHKRTRFTPKYEAGMDIVFSDGVGLDANHHTTLTSAKARMHVAGAGMAQRLNSDHLWHQFVQEIWRALQFSCTNPDPLRSRIHAALVGQPDGKSTTEAAESGRDILNALCILG